MKKILFLLLFCLVPLVLSAQRTLYVIDNVTVEHFDGSQLKGKLIQDYRISTSGSGRKAVTVHSITTVSGRANSFSEHSFTKEELERIRFHLPSTTSDNVVYIIDGKRYEDSSELKKLAPDNIKSIAVLKNDEARKKYDADGAIVIFTKSGTDEILKKVPGLKVETDGTLTLNGTKIRTIAINGQTISLE